jgi:hypothetical protein
MGCTQRKGKAPKKSSRVASRGATPEPPTLKLQAPDPDFPWPLQPPALALMAAPGPLNGRGHGGRSPLPPLGAERQRFSGARRGKMAHRRATLRWSEEEGRDSDELWRWRCGPLAKESLAAAHARFGPDLGPAATAFASAPQLSGLWGGFVAVNAVATEVKMASFGRPFRRVQGGAAL